MKRVSFKHKIADFSPHLFWDVDRSKLDFEANAETIIKSVLEYGLMNDWKVIYRHYGLKRIAETVMKLKDLDPRALSFIAALIGLPKERFRCYTTKRLTPPHWNF
jgi:hypothetical protein